MNTNKNKDGVIATISKDDVEELSLSQVYNLIEYFREEPFNYHDTMHLVFDGYNEDPREIYAIPEIRNWVTKLVYTFPDILYYLDEELNGLNNIILCLSEFKSIKGIPGTIGSTHSEKVFVWANIRSEQLEAISLQLAVNPFTLTNEVVSKVVLKRLLDFGKHNK